MLVISENEGKSSLLLRVGGDALVAELGSGLPGGLPEAKRRETGGGSKVEYEWGSVARLEVEEDAGGKCYHLEWKTSHLSSLQDSFEIGEETLWYGGPEERTQRFPLTRGSFSRECAAVLPGDYLQDGGRRLLGGVADPWWLSSRGVGLWAPEGVPLFYSWNEGGDGKMRLTAKYDGPYNNVKEEDLSLRYTIVVAGNAREAQLIAVERFLGKPEGTPDHDLLRRPIWSTWAEFKEKVDQRRVLDFARSIAERGLPRSQLEIDDRWEARYGDLEFDREKFPDPREMVRTAKEEFGFSSVTLWVHPFVNRDCACWEEAVEKGYLVGDSVRRGLPGLTSWWQGKMAGCVDFTNQEAKEWWFARLERLRQKYGVDSFKFDAGEPHWLPTCSAPHPSCRAPTSHWPASYATALAEAVCSSPGGRRAEVRVGRRTQRLPVLVRMLDRESRWGHDNGLKSLVSSALQFSLCGYPFSLPDMVGGNAYGDEAPSEELFVRWAQAAALMPAVQFSFAPWNYGEEVTDHVRRLLGLRLELSGVILGAGEAAKVAGEPVLRPVWWEDPEDREALRVGDQFLVGKGEGGQLLVAPVLEEGAVSRDVYLPKGSWREMRIGKEKGGGPLRSSLKGPMWLKNLEADLWTLPLFERTN